jgi:uncharacterized BrkB/YihY/UPF0761 family membrane protein
MRASLKLRVSRIGRVLPDFARRDILRSVTANNPAPVSRFERILAFMLLGLVLLSVGTFLAIIIGTWQGMGSSDFAGGIWPVVVMVPYIGLPLAFVVLITLMITNVIRRSRENKRTTTQR